MKLILVRHGETEWNIEHRVQGQRDVLLNKKGKEQARKVALRLKNERIDVIYSSDLKRAKHTALEIAKFHKVPLKYYKLLRERSFGKIEGMPVEEYRKMRERTGLPVYLYRPPGGENYVDLQKRVKKFLEEIKKKHSKENVLVVSHGGVIRTSISVLTGSPLEHAHEIEQRNTAVNVMELSPGSPPKIHYLNSTEHL